MYIEQFKLIDLSCPLCKENFTEMEILNAHVTSHSNNLQCELCSEMFSKKKGLKLHKQLVHTYDYNKYEEQIDIKEEPDVIETKVKTFDPDAVEKKRIAKLRRHNIACVLNMSTATPFKYYMNRFRCFYCSKNHPEFEPIKSHALTKHTYCDPEGIAMKSIKGKDAIVKVDISSLACKLCCISISDLDALSDHLVSIHHTKHDKLMMDIVQPFKIAKDNMACPLCPNVAFRYFVKLLEHMNESHSNNNVICVYCGQAFRSTPSYRGHLARYHRPNSCKCPDCDLVFPNPPKLTTHRANAHGAKAFKCSKCSERFATQYLRQKHLIDAHGSGHKCSYCDRMFARNSYMKDHIRKLHLKEKNVECSVCKEKFFDKTRLNIHMVKHIGERNYHCDICGKTFLWKKNLRGHMSSHKRSA
ncbi:zinc finger protein 26-like [Cydia splendana]|uniref:zinc finger protein 26-like n=1 Tax=Cydia splendana TaxID=1100963 RepID=UPI00300C6AF2